MGFPLLSIAISRVGNGGVKSVHNGYEITVPGDFSNIQFYADENARLFNINSFFSPLKSIDLRNFASEFPTLVGKLGKDIENYLLSNEWKNHGLLRNCASVYSQETSTTLAYIAVWSSSKGYVLVAEKTDHSKAYLESILDSTVLDPGACQW